MIWPLPLVYPGCAVGVGGEHFGQAMFGRKQEVEIRGGGGGAVPDEAEGGFALRAASHVGAEEGGGFDFFMEPFTCRRACPGF